MTQRSSTLVLVVLALGPLAGAGPVRDARPSPRAGAYLKYFAAQEAMNSGRLEDARRLLEEILAADPDAAVVHAALARLCLRSGDLDCAEARGARSVELDPAGAEGHKILADLDLQRYGANGEPAALEAALAHLAAAAEHAPLDVSVWVGWIRALAGERRDAEAEDVARRAAAVPGVDAAVPWMTLAKIYLARSEPERAIATLDRIDIPGRSAIPILETLADLKASRGDTAGSLAALEKLRVLKPEDLDVAHRLGVARLEMGDFFGALAPLHEAHEARPIDPLVRRDLARVLVRLGRGGEALELVDGLPPVYRAPHTLLLWAQAAEQAGRFGVAADRLDELLEALSTDDRASYGPALRLRIARNRVRSGEFARALALTEKGDDDPPALRVHLQALDGLGRASAADDLLRTRLAARHDDPAAIALQSERAQRRDGTGLETALAAITRAASPTLTAAQVAAWFTAWDDPRLGARILEATPLPRSPDPNVLRAWASTMLAAGRSGEAEPWFRQLLAQEPNDHVTLNDLGYLLASDGRSLDEAERLVRRALDLRPDEPAYLDSLGWTLHRAGRSADALPLLKKAAGRARERDEAGIRQHLGDVYLALGDRERARAEWQAAIALGSDQAELLRRKIGDLRAEQATR